MYPDGIYRTGDNFLSSSAENFLILTAKMRYLCHTSFLVCQVNLSVMH
jgi:hypothetical protein